MALTLIAVAVGIALLRYMEAVFIPFVLALLLFYALDPFVDRMERWRLPRAIGAALMVLLVVASVGGLIYFLQDEAISMVERLPQAIQRVRGELTAGPQETQRGREGAGGGQRNREIGPSRQCRRRIRG